MTASAQVALGAAMMLATEHVYEYQDSPAVRPGKWRNNREQKEVAFAKRVEKRRAKNKAAKQARKRNRR